MTAALGPLIPTPRTGDEAFQSAAHSLGFTVLDFWRWSNSDLVSNASRGILAEYIVAQALGGPTVPVRDEWAMFDLLTDEGVRVEVKSSAYLQVWHQNALSEIHFATPKTRAWDPESNIMAANAARQANVYVFALLAHQDKATLDPLNVDQWIFFALATAALNNRKRSQHSIGLTSLKSVCREVGYGDLPKAVQWAAIVGWMASIYSDGQNGMGMQYSGGPVTIKHLKPWFMGRQNHTVDVFGTEQPDDEQLGSMGRDITVALGLTAF